MGIYGSHQNLSIWSVLAVFVSYCTLFWGRGEFRGHLLQSSKLVDLVRYRTFHELLHTVWRSGNTYVGILVVIKIGRFCSFTQFSWAIAHCFFGSGDNFVGILGSHQNWSILSFHSVFMGYCTLFWSP